MIAENKDNKKVTQKNYTKMWHKKVTQRIDTKIWNKKVTQKGYQKASRERQCFIEICCANIKINSFL